MQKKTAVLSAALFVAAFPLFAQEKAGGASQMPDPKTREHEVLKQLVGDWDCTMKMPAMPGVPGMEKPTESQAHEHADLVCGGLYVKSTIDGICNGKRFQGLFVAGYDQFQKVYTGIFVDSQDTAPATMQGTYDAGTKTWSWHGKCPQGEMRSVLVMKDADNSVENCFLKGADGKEGPAGEITRKRLKTAPPVEAAMARAETVAKECEILQKEVGEWDAVVKPPEVPGQPAKEENATEHVAAVCGGTWLWSDFHGTMMGQPFEGHSLFGYDGQEKKYVGWWLDSMSGLAMHTTGSFDDAKKSCTMTGNCIDGAGKPYTVKEVLTWKSDDSKQLVLDFKGENENGTMEIRYTRRHDRGR
jgi:hypothetical protein